MEGRGEKEEVGGRGGERVRGGRREGEMSDGRWKGGRGNEWREVEGREGK